MVNLLQRKTYGVKNSFWTIVRQNVSWSVSACNAVLAVFAQVQPKCQLRKAKDILKKAYFFNLICTHMPIKSSKRQTEPYVLAE